MSVDPAGADVRVTEDGAVRLFARADVRSLVVDGAANGRNVVQNNTDIDSVRLGGNLADHLSGGTGGNFIKPGPGNDVVRAVGGSNTIDVAGQGIDRVLTTAAAAVTADRRDRVVTFFAPGREAGSGFVGVADGVLYIAATDHNGDGADRIELLRALYIGMVRSTGDDTVTGAGRNDFLVG